MNHRRQFLLLAPALGAAFLRGESHEGQSFQAGTCLGGRQADAFWTACDTVSQLGFHNIESSGGGVRLVDVYAANPGQLKDELGRRSLKLLGYAHYSQMADPAQRADLISLHLRIARTLQPIGTKYITHLLIPPPKPGVAAHKLPAQMTAEDFKNFGRNANEVARRVREETGLHIGYHPETVDVAAGLVDRILDSVDPRYFDFVADVGHLKAGGLDPMQVYKNIGRASSRRISEITIPTWNTSGTASILRGDLCRSEKA